jgi:ribosomal protein L11 methyltransferase
MPAWKNITLSLPGQENLRKISDKILSIKRILSMTIIDRLPVNQSDWFDQPGEKKTLTGKTHLIQLLVSAMTESKDLVKDLGSLINDNSIEIITEEIFEDRDWIQHSKNQFSEIIISDRLRIIPPWIADKGFSGKTIMIEPGSGFGTGSHPTTQLCIKWMETHLSSALSVLDYGCGSGILSITSKMLGAKTVLGIDNDYQALRNAKRNKDLNPVEIDLLHTSEYKNTLKFDIVIANILLKTIISLKKTLLTSLNPNGKLLLTGILKDQAIELISTFSPEISLSIIGDQEGWVLFSGENN